MDEDEIEELLLQIDTVETQEMTFDDILDLIRELGPIEKPR